MKMNNYKDYKAKCIALFALLLSCTGGGSTPECDSWNSIKTNIENRFKNIINCTIRSDCNGLDCVGKYHSYNFNVSAEIDPCKKPAVIDMFVDIPNTSLRNMTHTLKDGDKYKLPGLSALGLFVDVSLKEEEDRKLNVEIKVNVDKMAIKPITIISNCTIVRAQCINSKGSREDSEHHHAHTVMPTPQIIITSKCGNCNETEECIQIEHGHHVCDCKKGYIRDEFSVCNEVMLNAPGKKCILSDLKGCDVNEICTEDYLHSPNGTCECLPDFHPNSQNQCVPDTPSSEPETNVSLILCIVIPICFLILFSACVFVMIKQKMFQRLRDRFRNVTRYEILSIGNDDDDDDPLVVS